MVHEFEEYRPYRSIQVFRREIGKYVAPAVVAEYEKYIFVPIDINQADAPTLIQISGLDQSEAESLIAGRPYASPDAFLTKLSDRVSASELETARTYLNQP
jgi:radical SAM superfamily enzyme with C-terminal helix-hairpin-helix motif